MTLKTLLVAGIMLWAPALTAQELPRVMIQTDLGSMEVEVDTVKNPDAAGNFLIYVDQGAYQGSRFHRTIRAERLPGGRTEIEGIQGEVNPSRSKDIPPMALENKKDTGLSQGGRALSLGGDKLDAPAPDFFIRVWDQLELGRLDPDGKSFTPIGRVVRGREVVRLIHTARSQDQRLTPPITIISIKRVR